MQESLVCRGDVGRQPTPLQTPERRLTVSSSSRATDVRHALPRYTGVAETGATHYGGVESCTVEDVCLNSGSVQRPLTISAWRADFASDLQTPRAPVKPSETGCRQSFNDETSLATALLILRRHVEHRGVCDYDAVCRRDLQLTTGPLTTLKARQEPPGEVTGKGE